MIWFIINREKFEIVFCFCFWFNKSFITNLIKFVKFSFFKLRTIQKHFKVLREFLSIMFCLFWKFYQNLVESTKLSKKHFMRKSSCAKLRNDFQLIIQVCFQSFSCSLKLSNFQSTRFPRNIRKPGFADFVDFNNAFVRKLPFTKACWCVWTVSEAFCDFEWKYSCGRS